jgi:hypothetical protein
MNTLWINKWKPKKLSDIIGHSSQIKQIKNWLSNLENTKIQSIIVVGNHGIGKTITVKLILKELGYKTKFIYPNEIKELRTADNFSDFYNYKNSIFSKMNINSNIDDKKIALVFDETESISLTSEKKYVFNIFKMNNKTKSFPLIFIANNQHSKLLTDLKKYSPEIRLYSPNSIQVSKLIFKICQNEKIKINDKKVINKLINFSQYDIRRLINMLQELSYHYKKKEIKEDDINNYIKNSREKNIDIGLFESTRQLLNSYESYDEIIKLYEGEKVLLPLMIHQNYKKKILNNSNSWDDKLYQVLKISDSISRGDNIETSIYTDQNWYLKNIHGFYTCLNTSYWINKTNDKSLGPRDIKFSSDLNKTSLKNINKKNINNLLKIIPRKSIEEILILARLSNYFIKNKEYDKLINILKEYSKDINIKIIELCLKIDKTNDFYELSPKEKKIISQHIS